MALETIQYTVEEIEWCEMEKASVTELELLLMIIDDYEKNRKSKISLVNPSIRHLPGNTIKSEEALIQEVRLAGRNLAEHIGVLNLYKRSIFFRFFIRYSFRRVTVTLTYFLGREFMNMLDTHLEDFREMVRTYQQIAMSGCNNNRKAKIKS